MPIKVGVKEYKFYVVHIFTKKCVQITDRYSIQRKKIFWRDIYILESKEKGIKKMLINPILYKKGDILDQILANKINECINYLK